MLRRRLLLRRAPNPHQRGEVFPAKAGDILAAKQPKLKRNPPPPRFLFIGDFSKNPPPRSKTLQKLNHQTKKIII